MEYFCVPPGTGSSTHSCATGDRYLDTLTLHSQNVQNNSIQQSRLLNFASLCFHLHAALACIRALPALALARSSEAKYAALPICCIALILCTFCEWSVSVSRNLSPVAHECVAEPVPGGTRMCQGTCPR